MDSKQLNDVYNGNAVEFRDSDNAEEFRQVDQKLGSKQQKQLELLQQALLSRENAVTGAYLLPFLMSNII